MTLIRTDIQATVKHSPIEDIDIQEITVWFGNEKFIMYNVYCPPPSKVELSFKEVAFTKTIVAGDFNAHIPSLEYSDYNPTRQIFACYKTVHQSLLSSTEDMEQQADQT